MSAANDIELELDHRIDSWLEAGGRSVIGRENAGETAGSGETGGSGEIDDLMLLVGLVADHGFSETITQAPGPVSPASSSLPSRRSGVDGKGAWFLRVAAIILLIAALGVGLGLGFGGRNHGSGQPTNAGPRIPASLLNAFENDAGFWGDPYPAQPIQWVKTTTTRIDSGVDHKLFGASWRTAVPRTVWIGELYGNFYGQPAHRTGLFHWDVKVAFVGQGERAPTVSAGEIGTYYRLSEWGTVYSYSIPTPPAQPPVSPLRPAVMRVIEHDLAVNGEPYPSSPALWVNTTLGRFESLTSLHPGGSISLLGSGAQVGLAEIPLGTTHLWIVWGSRGGHYSYLGPASSQLATLDSANALSQLGAVHESFVGPALPSTLPGYVTGSVTEDLQNRYLNRPLPAHAGGTWTVTTVSDLEQAVLPQVNGWLEGVPGGMPVFVIDIAVSPTKGHPGESDWVLVTPAMNGTSGLRVGTFDEGGSALWGITNLSQLGPVHQVRFERSGGSYKIAP